MKERRQGDHFLVHFVGSATPKAFHTDWAPEFIMAARNLPRGPYPHSADVPGVPQTSGVPESQVKKVIRGTRMLLLQAGLPHCWWPFAMRCFASLNSFADDGGSPAARRHDAVGFSGPLIPFGALAHAMPSGLHRKRNFKKDPPPETRRLSWIYSPGLWQVVREAHVGFRRGFRRSAPFSRARWSDCRVTVHSGRDLRFGEKGPIHFACSSIYRRDNEAVEGTRPCLESEDPAAEDEETRYEAAADYTAGKPDHEVPDHLRGDIADPEAAPSETRPLMREEFPTAVYDEIELLDEEIKSLRHQLEFIPSGRSTREAPNYDSPGLHS